MASFLEKIKARRAAEAAAREKAVAKEICTENIGEVNRGGLRAILAQKKAPVAAELIAKAENDKEENTSKTQLDKSEETEFSKSTEMEVAQGAEITENTENSETSENQPEQTIQEIVEEGKAEADDAQPEEKPKRRRRRSKIDKAEKQETPRTISEVNQEDDCDADGVLGVNADYKDIAGTVIGSFEDAEWIAFKDDVTERLNGIKVAADMNPGMLKITLTELSDLYGMIAVPYSNLRALLEALTNKEDGVCTAIRKSNVKGSNEAECTASGYRALKHAQYNGEEINFIFLVAATRHKYYFLDSIKARIKFMSDLCVTMLESMKPEEKLTNGN